MNLRPTLQKGKRIGIQTGLILLVSFSLCEVGLRIYHHFKPSLIFFSDSYNRYRARPFADDWDFKLNSQGFKDLEFTEKKEDGYRILGIGDSFAYGVVPYRHNYLTLIESKLQEENSSVEVLNMGIPSIGPRHYLSLVIKEGLVLKPDMILLSFFIGNDFIDSKRTREIYSYSYVASLLYYIVRIPKFEGHGKRDYCNDCPRFDYQTYLEIERKRSFIYWDGNKRFMKLLDDALYYLNQIRHICETRDIEFVVVLIPDELQINQVLQTEILETFYPNLEQDRWDITLPNSMLEERFHKLGVHHIDLYECFAEKSQQQLYIPRNTHWNVAGNQLAADIIQNRIRKYLEDAD